MSSSWMKRIISRRLIAVARALYLAVARDELWSRWHQGLRLSLPSQVHHSLIDRVKLILWLEACASTLSIGLPKISSHLASTQAFGASALIQSQVALLSSMTNEQAVIQSCRIGCAGTSWSDI